MEYQEPIEKEWNVKKLPSLVITVAMLFSACSPREGIAISDAWIRPAAQGTNGAVYFVIHNYSAAADELTGISIEVAKAAEMHTSQMNGDVMQMDHVQAVPLPADAETRFEPGGLHIMLVDLKRDLKAGDQIELTLQFRDSKDLTLSVPVSDTPVHGENH
jgi:copper(I)-binding protein